MLRYSIAISPTVREIASGSVAFGVGTFCHSFGFSSWDIYFSVRLGTRLSTPLIVGFVEAGAGVAALGVC
jgi:hypothetical protein